MAVTAIPDDGYHFVGWSGDTQGDSASPTQNLTMDQARTLTATFEPDPVLVAPLTQTASSKLPAAPVGVSTSTGVLPTSLTLTILATADGTSLACTPDGRCAIVAMRDGVATVIFPDGVAPLTGVPAMVLQAAGADTNANGLPDVLDSALGFPLTDGVELLTVRETDGWLLLETPYIDSLRIEGAAIPATQLPATWQVSPAR